MADLITFVETVFGLEIATLGTVAVTPGLIAAGALIFSLGLSVFKRARGR
jgi:hypothetical protein